MQNGICQQPVHGSNSEFKPIMPDLDTLVKEPYTNLPNGFTKKKVEQIMRTIYFRYIPKGSNINPNVDTAGILCWYGDDVAKIQKDIYASFGIKLKFDYIYQTPVLDLYTKLLNILSVRKPLSEIMGVLATTEKHK